jgi:hypothetical protein
MACQPQADFTLDLQAILDVINTVREEIEPGTRDRREELCYRHRWMTSLGGLQAPRAPGVSLSLAHESPEAAGPLRNLRLRCPLLLSHHGAVEHLGEG